MEKDIKTLNLYYSRKSLGTIALLSAIFISFYISYMFKLHPQAAFMDTLRFLTYFDDSESGVASIFKTWSQDEHRGLFFQASIYLNAKLFNLDVFGSTLASGIPILLTAVLLSFEQYKSFCESERFTDNYRLWAGFSLLTFFVLFGLSGWELYPLAFGIVNFSKNLVFVLFWICLDRILSSNKQSRFAQILLLVAAPLVVLTIAYGWSYAFVIATAVCTFIGTPKNKQANTFRFALLAVLILSQMFYIFAPHLFSMPNASFEVTGRVASLTNMVMSLFYSLASIFMGAETMTALRIPFWMAVLTAICTIAFTAWLAFVIIRSKYLPSLVPTALVLYSGFLIVAISYARGRFDPTLGMASRYYMEFSLLFIGLVWIAVELICKATITFNLRRITRFATCLLVLFFILGQGLTTKDELVKAKYRNFAFQRMTEITLHGVTTSEEADFLQSNLETAKRAVEVQKKYGLGPFGHLNGK